MAGHRVLSRVLASFGKVLSLRTVSSSFRPEAFKQLAKIDNLPSFAKMQTGTFSTCNIQANAWKTGLQGAKYWQKYLLSSQRIFAFNSAGNFAKESLVVNICGNLVIPKRCVNSRNKHGKPKTCKAVANRFFRTADGNLKFWRPGKNHKMMKKGPKRSRQLRKPVLCNKRQLKLLNKMLGRGGR
ncbi:uncharacterized protein LOC111331117 [Stylophora pistillata]|uniref:50S ribosomal protein L35 n=1 Tax=Stylophora pistillata TaxID=50429 RepID=A0A2B4S8H6_STYPI|nr:uncharacterized protein LOC111331117 [Stylophora pistillata]PFX24832.1 50S ribosomal protein L35 [Stylophora pistillata]